MTSDDIKPGDIFCEGLEPIIKVVGVGGGGVRAVGKMQEQNIPGVTFAVIDTDSRDATCNPITSRLLIGPTTTEGMGSGNYPDLAKQAAEESANDIAALFDDGTNWAFITAGMGGGTGTGVSPVVARIARDKGIFTIGVVAIPFRFEGQKKILRALPGVGEMRNYVDALIVINYERLVEQYGLDFDNVFVHADEAIASVVANVVEIITKPGTVHLEPRDVKFILSGGGMAIVSAGYGEGEHRMTKALDSAFGSPLLKNRNIDGCKKFMMNIYFSRKSSKPFKMSEVSELQEFMQKFGTDIDVVWGVVDDDTLGDRIKVTILASGMDVDLDDYRAEYDIQS